MSQIELEKIADFFDKDRSGMIDLSDIMSTLKGGSRRTRKTVVQEVVSDAQKIDTEVRTAWAQPSSLLSDFNISWLIRYKCKCLTANAKKSSK